MINKGKVVSIIQVCDFELFPMVFKELYKLVDEIYVRFDVKRTSDKTIDFIKSHSKVKNIISGTYSKDKLWREELLRLLDPVHPDIVFTLDVDEVFDYRIESELSKFIESDKKAMMFPFMCHTIDGKRFIYPPKPHMKVFKWQPELTYLPYSGLCQIRQYRYEECQFLSSIPVIHYCFWTEDMRRFRKSGQQRIKSIEDRYENRNIDDYSRKN